MAPQTHSAPSTFDVSQIGQISAVEGRFALHIDEPFRPALGGVSDFSHLIVTWWADRANTLETHGELIVAETPYVDGPDNVGVLATRSPLRPSKLGLSVSAITAVDIASGVIKLGWIDAIDRTPVVDIKPYFPSSDRVRDVRMPAWCAAWPEWLEDSAHFDWDSVLRPDA